MLACIAITKREPPTGDEDADTEFEVCLFESHASFNHWLRFNEPPKGTQYVVVETQSASEFMRFSSYNYRRFGLGDELRGKVGEDNG